jgi:hypothetical protein
VIDILPVSVNLAITPVRSAQLNITFFRWQNKGFKKVNLQNSPRGEILEQVVKTKW